MATPNDIYNEITRIDNAKQGIAEAIEEKGVQVPAGTPIQDFPGKVRQIQTGSPDAVLFTPQDLTPEQQAQARQNIGAGTYTKPNTGIPATDFAQGVQTSLEKANTAVQPDALTPITDLIPEQATPQNQLADKNFVNSSVATNTANYISDNGQPFQSVADLEAYTGPLTNNDYAFVVGTDSAGNTTYTRYKYNATTQTWAAEYVLNNSSFTAEQWAAISSGITALLVQKLSELPTEIVTYVAQTLTEAQKQQARTNIGATAPEIFVCTYNVTTFNEVKEAYRSGKLCVCDRNGNYYVFAIWQGDDAPCYFSCGITGRIFYLRLSPNNTWFNSSYIFQQTSDKSQSIETDRESTTKYPSVKAVADALGKWGVISQTHTWTGSDAVGWDNVVSDQVWGIIPQNNIDLFEVIGAIFNDTGADITRQDIFGYDIIHKNGCFYLEGLGDISYNEMLVIYEHRWAVNQLAINSAPNPPIWSSSPARYGQKTFYHNWNSPVNIYQIGSYSLRGLEVINLLSKGSAQTVYLAGVRQCFYQARALKRVYPFLDCSNCTGTGATYNAFYDSFNSCCSLEEIRLKNVKINVPITKSSRLSLASIVYLVSNAANTTAITITLHATAYARCQADMTEYTYNEQTYTGIIAYAAAKNITIASA